MNRTISRASKITMFVATALVCGSLAGCGGGGAEKTYAVNGKVVYQDGTPVVGAGVAFVGKDYTASGTTGEDGTFTLTTFEDEGDGAPAGDYQVAVELYKAEAGAPADLTKDGTGVAPVGDDPEPPGAPAEAVEVPVNLLDPMYADGTTSGLTATVSATGENKFEFKVKKAAGGAG